jgi:flavin-dependent dehydrogenase
LKEEVTMTRRYDLIVVGGGPGGLMAAKTAAEDGLNVVLIERKRNITEIHRACVSIFYTHKLSPVASGESDTGELHGDGYIEPVSVECESDKTRFHFPAQGFSIDYNGPLRPYLNWIYVSPSGYPINWHKWNDRPWGFYYHKEIFLAGLLASVENAGAKVLPETIGLWAENTKDGVRVRVRGKSAEQTLEAGAAIAADGINSMIVDSLGLNEKRQELFPPFGRVGSAYYIMEGVETGLPDSSWVDWVVPSINSRSNIMLGLWADNRHVVGPSAVLDKFMNDPRYTHMFRHARVVEKRAFTAHILKPIREPVAGNVVIVGDAAAPAETWIQGAVAMAYRAVKAIEKELNDQKGYPEYINWWQRAFAFNSPKYVETLGLHLRPLQSICSDEDIDYIHNLFRDKIGVPVMMVTRNLELIKKERPELHEKLTKGT